MSMSSRYIRDDILMLVRSFCNFFESKINFLKKKNFLYKRDGKKETGRPKGFFFFLKINRETWISDRILDMKVPLR